jgi:hypothetical protein
MHLPALLIGQRVEAILRSPFASLTDPSSHDCQREEQCGDDAE